MNRAIYSIPVGWDLETAEDLVEDVLAIIAPDGQLHVISPIGHFDDDDDAVQA